MTLILILLVLGFILVGAEVLLPGGILGLIALIVFVIATVVATNTYGGTGGLITFAASALGSAITFFSIFKWVAISPSGGGLRLDAAINGNSSSQSLDPALVGQTGVTATKMAPNGLVSVGDQDLQAHSEDGFLDIGTAVTIHGIRHGNIVVRKTV
ncbi:MAG: NfeD family protein [Opitutales bacterium]